MMGGCNTRNMYKEELSEIKYLRLLHQVGFFHLLIYGARNHETEIFSYGFRLIHKIEEKDY